MVKRSTVIFIGAFLVINGISFGVSRACDCCLWFGKTPGKTDVPTSPDQPAVVVRAYSVQEQIKDAPSRISMDEKHQMTAGIGQKQSSQSALDQLADIKALLIQQREAQERAEQKAAQERTEQKAAHERLARDLHDQQERLDRERKERLEQEKRVTETLNVFRRKGEEHGCAICTDRGSMAHVNQDRAEFIFGEAGDGAIAVLADGHGQYGHRIAKVITGDRGLARAYWKELSDATPRESMKRAFKVTDDSLPLGWTAKSGAAVAVVHLDVRRNRLLIAHTGDSRVIVGKKNGVVAFATPDHKPFAEKEFARIAAAGGCVYWDGVPRVYYANGSGGLALSRSIGDRYLRGAGVISEPEISIVPIGSDIVSLAVVSDGVVDKLSDKTIAKIATRGNVGSVAITLMAKSKLKNKDDRTVLITDIPKMMTKLKSGAQVVVRRKDDRKDEKEKKPKKTDPKIEKVTHK